MSFKQKVFSACCALLEEKIISLKNILTELEEGTQSDSKSSAGDKHETARAMMQIEQEKIARQLGELLEQKSHLEKNGVLVKTNKGFLFLCVPLGKVPVDDITVMAISPQSPLGINLNGLKSGDQTEINGTSYLIESIE